MNVAVLAPNLDGRERKLLTTVLHKSTLPLAGGWSAQTWTEIPAVTWAEVQQMGARHVLSVGKQALDTWHHYGLIHVHAHHGKVFVHTDDDAARTKYTIMQLEHPGTLLQMSLGGHTARAEMLRDLADFGQVLHGTHVQRFAMAMCGKCQTARVAKGKLPVRRVAVHWDERLDLVGLCEDHWRTRAKITRKDKKMKKVTNMSKPEAQVPGQMVMGGVVVRKV